jgi:hypothetical protein
MICFYGVSGFDWFSLSAKRRGSGAAVWGKPVSGALLVVSAAVRSWLVSVAVLVAV